MDNKKKKSRKGLGVALGAALIGILSVAFAGSNSTPAHTEATSSPVVNQIVQEAANSAQEEIVESSEGQPPEPPQFDSSDLSNDNYYTNVDGNQVHSPAYSESGCEAAGASAECGDGTCSFSQNRRGTCSHHGEVAQWLY